MDPSELASERRKLEDAIAAQESLRGIVDSSVIEATILTLREKLLRIEEIEVVQRQRKLVSLLFMDMVASTQSMRAWDPEDVMEIMDDVMQLLARSISGHGGRVVKFLGDGFIAVFGEHHSQENDPERAIRAGLEIIDKSKQIKMEFGEKWKLSDFQVRIGVNTGMVAFGGNMEGENTMAGSTVNLAARLEKAAPPGGLLISHDTYRHVRGVFNVSPQEPILLKGFDEPVLTYLVINPKPRAFRTPTRGVEGIETRMVGRLRELRALQETFHNLLDGGAGHIFTISGDAGVGKSRLLYEFDQWIELLPEQIWFYKGRCLQERQNNPLGVVRDLIAYRFQIKDDDPTNVIWKKFENGFGDVYEEDKVFQMRAHILGQYLGYDFSQSEYLRGALSDPKQIRERGIVYLDDYFEMITRADPAVIFLEDLHWADESSLDLIDNLARKVSERRMMIVCMTRPTFFERRPDWGKGVDDYTRMDIHPLSKDDGRLLVQEILRYVDHLPDALGEMIVNNAEGNPFYIEELIKKLIEDGVIKKGEEQWYVDMDRFEPRATPTTLTGLLQSRLDTLQKEQRKLLQMASVFGRIFWSEPLQYITEAQQEVDASAQGIEFSTALEILHQKEMIFRREVSTISGSVEYVFKHQVLREVTYNSTPKAERKIYHRLASEWLIANITENIDHYAGVIANHSKLGGLPEQAIQWFFVAVESVKSRGMYKEMLSHLHEIDGLTIAGNNKETKWKMNLLLSEALGILGEIELRKVVDDRIIELATDLHDRDKLIEAYYRKGYSCDLVSDFQQALDYYSRALRLIEDGKNVSIKGRILSIQSNIFDHMGNKNAAEMAANQALQCAEVMTDGEERAMILTNISNHYSNIGNLYTSTILIEEILETVQGLGNKYGESLNLGNLGYNYLLVGKFTQGRAYLEKAIEISKLIGAPSPYFRLNKIIALIRLGILDEALQLSVQLNNELIRLKDKFAQGVITTYTGLIHEKMGEYTKAVEDFSRAVMLLVELQMFSYARDAQAGKIRCTLKLGDLESALKEAQTLKDDLNNLGTVGMEFPTLAYLTCVDIFHETGLIEDELAILQKGYTELMQQVDNIGNDDWRESFLHNIPENMVLISRWEKVFGKS